MVVSCPTRWRRRRGALTHRDRRGPHRCDDVRVAGTPAEVALDRVADLRVRGIGVASQQVGRGNDHARGAEAALQAVLHPRRPSGGDGARRRRGLGLPSMVVTRRAVGWTANIVQLLMALPSTCTVQAPQLAGGATDVRPVRSRSSRRASDQQPSGLDIELPSGVPFTVREMCSPTGRTSFDDCLIARTGSPGRADDVGVRPPEHSVSSGRRVDAGSPRRQREVLRWWHRSVAESSRPGCGTVARARSDVCGGQRPHGQ